MKNGHAYSQKNAAENKSQLNLNIKTIFDEFLENKSKCCHFENNQYIKKLPRQIYSKLPKVSFKHMNSKKNVIQFYTHLFFKDFKDLSRMLSFIKQPALCLQFIRSIICPTMEEQRYQPTVGELKLACLLFPGPCLNFRELRQNGPHQLRSVAETEFKAAVKELCDKGLGTFNSIGVPRAQKAVTILSNKKPSDLTLEPWTCGMRRKDQYVEKYHNTCHKAITAPMREFLIAQGSLNQSIILALIEMPITTRIAALGISHHFPRPGAQFFGWSCRQS